MTALGAAGVQFGKQLCAAEHAFMRDEGHRYDPALANQLYAMAIQQLTSRLK